MAGYKRRVTFKRRAPSKRVSKTIKQLVKREVSKAPEHKRAFAFNGSNYTDTIMKSFNIPYSLSLAQGTAAKYDIIGNDIKLKSLQIRGFVSNNTTTPAQKDETIFTRIALVSVDKYQTLTNLSNTDVFTSPLNKAQYAFFDKDKVTVHKQLLVKTQPQISGASVSQSFQMNLNFKGGKLLRFQDFATSYELKGKNLYLVIMANTVNGTNFVDTAGGVTFNMLASYTDA
jgi:hypothetical protein